LQRPRILVSISGLTLAVTIGLSPALAAVALAAEPTIVVRPGDTLTAISKRHGVPIRRLVELNRIANPNRIFAGQRLRIGSGRAAAPSRAATATSTRIHVVNRGSTLWHIARYYGVSVPAIVAANGIANPSRIFAGQRLVIPGGRALPRRTSAPTSSPAVPASMAAVMAKRDWVRRIIVNAADRWGVPRSLALAVAWQESGWRQRVVSHAGAVGAMQLMPATADWVGTAMLRAPVDIHATRSNVNAGVRLLKHYLQRYSGNRDLILAAYYQGQRAVDHYGIYPISRPYIASVRHLERLFGG